MEHRKRMLTPLQPTLSFALRSLRPLGPRTYEAGPVLSKIMFYLRRIEVEGQNRCFYECAEPGCRGSFCPSFEVTEERTIPDWVFDSLRLHIELTHQPREGND